MYFVICFITKFSLKKKREEANWIFQLPKCELSNICVKEQVDLQSEEHAELCVLLNIPILVNETYSTVCKL